MFLPASLFLTGVAVLLLSADEFVKQSILFSSKLRISPLIIGTTIVAVGTSMPELVVSLISASKGDTGLGMGNIVGSNIINILLVLGLAVVLGKIKVGTTKTQKDIWLMVGVTALFVVLHSLGITNISGIILLLFFVAFSIIQFLWGINGRQHEDIQKIRNLTQKYRGGSIWVFIISLLGVIGGGFITVTQAEEISSLLGLSTTIFGLLATSTATSMPELAVTLISERRGQAKMALGNIIGSNVCNLSLIGGALFLFPKQISLGLNAWFYLIGSTLLSLIVITKFTGKVIPKWIGVIFLILLFGYFTVLIGL